MAKSFAGFTQQQTEVLARKLGFNGPMDQFQNYLKSNSGLQQKFSSFENKAKQMVEGAKEVRGFAQGGDTTPMWERLGYSSFQDYAEKTKQQATPTTTTPTTPNNGSVATPTAPTASGTTSPAATTKTDVTATTDGKTETATISAVVPNLNSEGQQVTKDMMTNPENYVTTPETSNIEVKDNQLIGSGTGQVGNLPAATAEGAANQTANATTVDKTATAGAVTPTDVNTYEASTVGDKVADVWDQEGPVQGTVSDKALVEAVTADPSVNATVAGQLANLMSQFEDGKTPAWAAGALRNVNAIMGSRGMGASTMASSAATQAAMESALQIAVADASTYSQFELTNLNNRQQAALQNAQAYLSMDLANLNIASQYSVAKMQSITQGLFSDQAATNAASQFNATSKNQADQFFAELSTQVQQFNAAQKNAMAQFNAEAQNQVDMFNTGQFNANQQFNASLQADLAKFNTEIQNSRDQFNANNQLVIAQSNAEWRRQVTTINNAEANENARLAATAANGMTAAAYSTMMQTERDYYAFLFQASENAQQRAADMVMAKYTASANAKAGKAEALGSLAGSVINGIFSKW